MEYPQAYILYLVHFHGDRDYFECHEILEDYWKKVAPKDQRSFWVGFIQIAVALYHHRRENMQGALRTIVKANNNLLFNQNKLNQLGIDVDKLFTLLKQTEERIVAGMPYQSINLPLIDYQLITQCEDECNILGLIWKSDPSYNTNIIHKHLKRDRTPIIQERARQLEIHALKNRG